MKRNSQVCMTTRWLFLFFASAFVLFAAVSVFFHNILPLLSPIITSLDDLWLFLIIVSFYFMPFTLLFLYCSVQAWGQEKFNWAIISFYFFIAFLYYGGLAFLFSRFIPSSYEPFRSATLPYLIIAATICVLVKTRIGQRLRQLLKLPPAQTETKESS